MRGLRSSRFHCANPLLLVTTASLLFIAAGCGAGPFNLLGKATPAPAALPTLGNSNVVVVTATLPVIGPVGTAPAPTATPPITPSIPVSSTVSVQSLPTPRATLTPLPASSGTTRVRIFLIAVNDNGVSGPKIGCGDSAIAVERDVPATKAPLTAALNELLSLHDQNYGQSGLYNSLYQSKLQLQSVAVVDGVATIKLTGTLTLGGVCDDPRVDAQLTNTALQFATVKSTDITINGKALKDVLSGK